VFPKYKRNIPSEFVVCHTSEAKVILPFNLVVPLTCKRDEGLLVPIPILPLLAIQAL
jgi:hypothetical protein